MATVANPFGTDQNQAAGGNQGQNTFMGGSSPLPGNSAGNGNQFTAKSPAAQGTNNPSVAPTSSGSFNNLQKYMSANQNFDSSQGGLGGEVANNINQEAQGVNQNLQGAQQTFQGAQNQFQNQESTDQQALNAAFQTPTNLSSNQQQNVINAENDQYTGPKGLQGLSGTQNLFNIQNQAQNVTNQANNAQTQSGQMTLLQQMFGNPSYTQGQQNLDQALLTGTPGGQAQLSALRGTANNLNQNINNAAQQANNQTQAAQQQAAQTQSNAIGGLNQAVANQTNNVNLEQANAVQSQTNATTQAQNDLQQGFLTNADITALGGTPTGLTQGMSLTNLTPAQIQSIITSGTAPTAQQTATNQDYNQFNALRQLMGSPGVANLASSAALQQFNNPALSGTNTSPQSNFNLTALQNAINSNQAQYAPQQQAIQNQLQATKQATASQIAGEIGGPEGLTLASQYLSGVPIQQLINQSTDYALAPILNNATNVENQLTNQLTNLNNIMYGPSLTFGNNPTPVQTVAAPTGFSK